MKKSLLVTLVILSIVNSPLTFAQSPREQLNQMVQQFEKNPGDSALRERIIKLAQEIKPPPAIPEEAERRIVRGTAAFKGAKSTSDYQDAAREFEQAALAAPWYADAYYNLATARSKAEDYAGAVWSLRFYLLAAPDAKDAKEAKALMYEMEYKQERADKDKAEKRVAEEKRTRGQLALEKLRGGWIGVMFTAYLCNYRNVMKAMEAAGEGGYRIEGCTLQEYGDKNWYRNPTLMYEAKFNFPGDGTIQLIQAYSGTAPITLVGIPNGPRVEDIMWSRPESRFENGKFVLTGKTERVWTRVTDDGNELVYSYDRPTNDSSFNPSARYTYDLIRKK